jgi:hypothetical protein
MKPIQRQIKCLFFVIVFGLYLSSSDSARSIFKKQHMRHFSGLFTSLWEETYDKRMDLALICLGKDVTPEKLEQKEKEKRIHFIKCLSTFLKKSVSNILVIVWDGVSIRPNRQN